MLGIPWLAQGKMGGMASISIRGIPHAYHLTIPPQASGPVLVFVHGWLLSQQYWLPILQRLQQSYGCLTYDLRGFGESQDPALPPMSPDRPEAESLGVSVSPYSPRAYAEDLLTLLEHLHIDEAWVVGHSLGGSIALTLADLANDRIQGVVCINAGGGIYLKEEFERFRAFGQRLVKYRPPWLQHLPGLPWMFSRFAVHHPLDTPWGKQRLVDFLRAEEGAALGSLLDSTTELEVHYLPQVVARLPQPAYFIGGDRDPIIEPQYVRHLASFHPLFQTGGQNWVELSNCGHFAMLEHPEAVATLLEQAVRGTWATHQEPTVA